MRDMQLVCNREICYYEVGLKFFKQVWGKDFSLCEIGDWLENFMVQF